MYIIVHSALLLRLGWSVQILTDVAFVDCDETEKPSATILVPIKSVFFSSIFTRYVCVLHRKDIRLMEKNVSYEVFSVAVPQRYKLE
jgi:hypothetical protein